MYEDFCNSNTALLSCSANADYIVRRTSFLNNIRSSDSNTRREQEQSRNSCDDTPDVVRRKPF